MRNRIILVLLLIVGHNLFAQSPYYDVFTLRKHIKDSIGNLYLKIDKTNVKELGKLLKYYDDNISDALPEKEIYAKLYDLFSDSPFITMPAQTREGVFSINSTSIENLTSSSVGGLSVTNFADGLAKFLVERFKQELSITFFTKFKEDLDNPKFSDLKILFPETWKTLSAIDKDIYQFSSYLNTLRQSFIKDMTNEFTNFQALLKQQKYVEYFQLRNPELGSMVYSSLYIINEISSGKHPGDVLAGFSPERFILPMNDKKNLRINLISSVKTIQLFSASIRSKSNTSYWVSTDSVYSMLADERNFKIYMGLVYVMAKKKKIEFANSAAPLPLTTVLESVSQATDSLDKYRYFIETLAGHAKEVDDYVKDIKNKKKSEIDYNDYYKLFNASIDLLDHIKLFVDLPYVALDKEKDFKRSSSKLIYVARSTSNLFIDVRTKNYSSAILNVSTLIDTLLHVGTKDYAVKLQTEYDNDKGALSAALKKDKIGWLARAKLYHRVNGIQIGSASGKWPDIPDYTWEDIKAKVQAGSTTFESQKAEIIDMVNVNRQILLYKDRSQLRTYVLKYGTFIATVAEAQNADDVKNAIESAALPAGSAAIKRHSSFSVSINSYVGFHVGDEYLKSSTDPKLSPGWGTVSGLSAPVGIAFNWQLNFPFKESSLSLFTSLIDIGAIVSYRFTDDSANKLPDITLENIFAPGIHLVYGIPKTPISIGYGWQKGPQLRTINVPDPVNPGQFKNDTVEGYRWAFFLAVDIPLLNLYTKSK